MITPTRNFNLTYIILDSVFIVFFLLLLLLKKEYRTLLFASFGGVLYFAVDFGLFYLASHSRAIYIDGNIQGDGITALVLLWMSLSYGITNFAFIWLFLKRDKHLVLWISLILVWWIACPLISMAGGEMNITTYRTTSSYHWIMAVFLIIGYSGLIVYNLFSKKGRANIIYLMVIGILVQLCWEGALLLTGIRPWNDDSLITLIIDSLVETNMGMPYILLIYLFVTIKLGRERYTGESLKKIGVFRYEGKDIA